MLVSWRSDVKRKACCWRVCSLHSTWLPASPPSSSLLHSLFSCSWAELAAPHWSTGPSVKVGPHSINQSLAYLFQSLYLVFLFFFESWSWMSNFSANDQVLNTWLLFWLLILKPWQTRLCLVFALAAISIASIYFCSHLGPVPWSREWSLGRSTQEQLQGICFLGRALRPRCTLGIAM